MYVNTIQTDTYSITRGWSLKVLFSMIHPLISADDEQQILSNA